MINKNICRKFDDGLGAFYGRIAPITLLENLAKKNKLNSLLELNAVYIAHTPGFTSNMLTQDNFKAGVMVNSQDYDETVSAWKEVGLYDKACIVKGDDDTHTPFKDNEYDIVWNHSVFEKHANPEALVLEMKRISKKFVINFVYNYNNLGVKLHHWQHSLEKQEWDHGEILQSRMKTLTGVYKKCGLKIVETGGVDVPPWLCTLDLEIGGGRTYLRNIIEGDEKKAKGWVWSTVDPDARNNIFANTFLNWEFSFPRWFKVLMAHHLYCIGEKVD
ncbi:MAG: methyltransferase domain-containing protein [bacterium]|nr:methyltransferase domain-containing protein [bacterium]